MVDADIAELTAKIKLPSGKATRGQGTFRFRYERDHSTESEDDSVEITDTSVNEQETEEHKRERLAAGVSVVGDDGRIHA